jgi:hypothetical protein
LNLFRHSIHPSNEDNTNQHSSPTETPITITTNPLTTTISAPDPSSHSSSAQSLAAHEDNHERSHTTSNNLLANLIAPSKSTSSLFAKLTDAKKSFFGRGNTPDPFFASAEENRALLSYILSEPNPQLEIIQEFERTGAQLNAITDEGNTAIHLLGRAEVHSTECINIIDYFIKKGCDPNRQNDYGWTAGKFLIFQSSSPFISPFIAHYALANRKTDLAVYLLKVMLDVNLPTFDAHNGRFTIRSFFSIHLSLSFLFQAIQVKLNFFI